MNPVTLLRRQQRSMCRHRVPVPETDIQERKDDQGDNEADHGGDCHVEKAEERLQ